MHVKYGFVLSFRLRLVFLSVTLTFITAPNIIDHHVIMIFLPITFTQSIGKFRILFVNHMYMPIICEQSYGPETYPNMRNVVSSVS